MLHLIVNRRARHLRSENTSLYKTLLAAARDARGRVIETRTLAELDEAVTAVVDDGAGAPTILAGGDGSYMAGLTALDRVCRARGRPLPPIGLAPGGTVGTVARNWGFSGSAARYAEQLVRDAAAGTARTTERPTLRVRDGAGGDRVGFIFGTGLVAQFFDLYYASSHQGYGGAARIVARIFVSSFVGGGTARRVLTPVPCKIVTDGHAHTAGAYSLVAASVVKDLGLHMHVLYRAGEDPERVHIVASPLGARKLGPQMPLVIAGRRLLGAGHVDELARTTRVTFTSEFDAYVLDGDVLRAPWIEISAGPRMSVLMPRT